MVQATRADAAAGVPSRLQAASLSLRIHPQATSHPTPIFHFWKLLLYWTQDYYLNFTCW